MRVVRWEEGEHDPIAIAYAVKREVKMTGFPCILCGNNSDYRPAKFSGKWIDCPSCGSFGITRELEINILSDSDAKTKAAMLAAERRVRKPESPIVLSEGYSGVQDGKIFITLAEFLSRYPKSVREIFDRVLLNLSVMATHHRYVYP